MRTEKAVLSFIAVMIGLFVAGVAFFIYQSTKAVSPSALPKITINSPSPTTIQVPITVALSITQPVDGSVVDTKSITITGKTNPDATIIISTPISDQVVQPTTLGDYSITQTLDSGVNEITLLAIGSNGQEVSKKIAVTYSTEDF